MLLAVSGMVSRAENALNKAGSGSAANGAVRRHAKSLPERKSLLLAITKGARLDALGAPAINNSPSPQRTNRRWRVNEWPRSRKPQSPLTVSRLSRLEGLPAIRP